MSIWAWPVWTKDEMIFQLGECEPVLPGSFLDQYPLDRTDLADWELSWEVDLAKQQLPALELCVDPEFILKMHRSAA